MAYAALISLRQTLDRLHNSHRIVLKGSSSESTRSLKNEVELTRAVLKKLKNSVNVNRNRIDVLDGKIRQAVHKFEDALEFHVSNQLLSQPDEERLVRRKYIQVDLQELKQDFQSFTQNLSKMKDAYSDELQHRPSLHNDDNNNNISNNYSEMVGLSDQFNKLKDRLTVDTYTNITLLGMAGIGKTTLATKLFQDPSILTLCSKRAFVTVGPEYELERVLIDILRQVDNHGFTKRQDQSYSLDLLREKIYQCLKRTTFFLVLDDVWDKSLWSNLKASFPKDNHRAKVLITTRVRRVADSTSGDILNVRLLSKEESWDLLRKNVFCKQQDSSLSRELEKAGKKIAERCEGLPLTIITVAGILSKSGDKITAEYWNEVAADIRHRVFIDAYDQMYNVLYPSYEYLKQKFKLCFLYMGVFPQTYEIRRSKIANMWTAEGLSRGQTESPTILHRLDSNSLVMVHKISFDGGIKTCSLYSPFWHLSNKIATKNKFFHGLNMLEDAEEEDLKGQRRLCIRNNVLFAVEDVYELMASVSTVRSVLCSGPYHKYPVPLYFGFTLVRILDALTVRYYEFPMKVVNLVQLMYLALTFEGDIHASICKLWNLHYLIVNRHLSIVRSDGISSYLPVEIWDMEKLNHLQVMGSDLPHPRDKNRLLENLSTLLDARPQSCTKSILKRIPNLEKLGIRIELGLDNNDDDKAVPLSCFDHLSDLRKLEELKCLIVNPRIAPEVVVVSLSILPSSLQKITFSGSFGYTWDEMRKISSLPNLKELKLRCYAFQGPKWKVEHDEFPNLRYLLIEDTDLVQWTFKHKRCLKNLVCLSIKHCYKLQEIPMKLGAIRSLETIKLVDCNPMALTCANKLKKAHPLSNLALPSAIDIHSSWDT